MKRRTVAFVAAGAGLLVALPLVLGRTDAVFSATTTNGDTFGSQPVFPVVSAAVLADSPWSYLRVEDAESAATATAPAAADSSGSSHPGTFNGPTSGVTTWWPENEGSGTTVHDKSGAVNTGTVSSGATWTTGRVAGTSALYFDGTANGVVTGAQSALHTNASFTVMAWCYLDDPAASAASAGVRPVLTQSSSVGIGFVLKYQWNPDRWQIYMNRSGGGSDVASASSSYTLATTDHTWLHVAATYTATSSTTGTEQMYINGAVSGSSLAHTGAFDSTSTLIEGSSFIGKIQDVRTYQRALSATEIAAAYGTGRTLRWSLDEASGTTTAEYSGNGNDGTLHGGVSFSSGGHSGTYANFTNAGTGYVTGTSSPVRTDTAFSISAWLNPATATGPAAAVAIQGSVNYAAVLQVNSSGKWEFSLPQGDGNSPVIDAVAGTTTVATGTWTHVVGVYDGTGTAYLYVNGALVASGTHRNRWNAGTPLELGRALTAAATYGRYWYGGVDDVRVYARALPATDVTAIYGGGEAAVGLGTVPEPFAGYVPGALQGAQQGQQASTAVAFRDENSLYIGTALTNPTAFTVECWFKTDTGGVLAGFGAATNGSNGIVKDRVLYVDSAGRLSFGVFFSGAFVTIRSPAAYNDGTWHHAAYSLGAAGMKLYADGELVAQDSTTTASSVTATGYWRFGGMLLTNNTNRPADDFLLGSMDEMSIWLSQLTDQQILWHYHANH